jgi:hypothetical protein
MPNASAAGTCARTSEFTPITPASAVAASQTCTVRAKLVPARNIDRWLWLAGIIVGVDQISKWLVLGAATWRLDLRRTFLQLGTDLQPRRGLQLPFRRRRLAALVLHGPGAVHLGLDRQHPAAPQR